MSDYYESKQEEISDLLHSNEFQLMLAEASDYWRNLEIDVDEDDPDGLAFWADEEELEECAA